MKKETHHRRKQHRTSADDLEESPESTSAQEQSVAEQSAANPFFRFARFIKRRFQKQETSLPSQELSLQASLATEKQPKPEFGNELKQLIASNDDAVNKLYQLDLILRRYYGKEYKVGKKLPYPSMITQLEQKQETAAVNLLKKIIVYAYSGKPLENPQMRELLSDFKQLIAANTAQHAAEKDAHPKKKSAGAQVEAREALADKLTPVSPQLPPQNGPFMHIPLPDLQKSRLKLRSMLDTLAKIRSRKVFAGVKLPSAIRRSQQKQSEQHSSKQPPTTHLHLRLPQLHLPEISRRDFKKLDVRRQVHTAIHTAGLHLPKVRLPEFNRHESHAPRVKLPSWRAMKENIAERIANTHFPQLRLPKVSNLPLPQLHLPQFKKPHTASPKDRLVRLPLQKAKPSHSHIHILHIRKLLHLPRFHPALYYERIKEHLLEMHLIEYAHTLAERIPRPHLREYYESLKQIGQGTWEKIHPPKLSEEEQALQAELEQEQAEAEQQTQNAQQPETVPEASETETPEKKFPTPLTPVPIVAKPETYWIEYRPRKHARGVQHHIAFDFDDFHHVKEIVKKHHKAALM